MVNLKEKFSIPAPPDEVWPLMSDPAVVAACIPGAELTELTPDGAHRGKVTFKFGPTVAVFRGEARLTYDHPAKRCLIEARGIDQKGASRARARFDVAGARRRHDRSDHGRRIRGRGSAGDVRLGGRRARRARAAWRNSPTNIANVIEQRRSEGQRCGARSRRPRRRERRSSGARCSTARADIVGKVSEKKRQRKGTNERSSE